jgi:RNA polymerase sigma factor (sigma-70 family)
MADNQTNGLDFERVWGEVEKTAHMMIRKFPIYGHEYDDLLQEARIECWKAFEDFDEKHNVKFNTYFFVRLKNRFRKLYQIANRKKEYYNQSRNSKLSDDFIEKFIESNYKTPEQLVIEEESARILKANINLLPYQLKRMVNLKIKGYETKVIAERFGVSSTTISTRLKTVREVLERKDLEYTKQWIEQWKKNQAKRPHYLNKKDPNG